jgi:Zn-dependent peptidase ImmA (M78 family)
MAILSRPQILKAIDRALRCRIKAGYEANEPVCVFDIATKLNVEVRFVAGNSFGGMYAKDFEKILIPTMRPPGRQAFTCAHELGHWAFGHGTRVELIDELDKGGSDDPDERMANVFASHLLMPDWAVADAFRRRSLVPARCEALECYRIANQLGIGYETLVQHLHYGVQLIKEDQAERLLRTSPKEIRANVLGTVESRHLVFVDQHWWRVPIDLTVGDALIMPVGFQADGPVLRQVGITFHGTWFEAVRPGYGRVCSEDSGWSSFVRSARKDYVGRSRFRFLEDPDVDEQT